MIKDHIQIDKRSWKTNKALNKNSRTNKNPTKAELLTIQIKSQADRNFWERAMRICKKGSDKVFKHSNALILTNRPCFAVTISANKTLQYVEWRNVNAIFYINNALPFWYKTNFLSILREKLIFKSNLQRMFRNTLAK